MLKLFKKLKWQEWIGVCFVVGLIILQVWLELKLPTYMKKITALIISPTATQKDIWSAGGEMIGFTLASVLASCVVGFIVARIAASFSKRLRGEIFNKIESFSLEEPQVLSPEQPTTFNKFKCFLQWELNLLSKPQ